MSITITIDKMAPDDWPAVRNIYLEGIMTGNATFETDLPDWEQWNGSHLQPCRLVARDGHRLLGWATLRPVSARQVYAGVAEVSIYIAAEARGRGIGKHLLLSLHDSEAEGLWTLQADIFPENAASIALHQGCGFREVGVRQRVDKTRRLLEGCSADGTSQHTRLSVR